MLRTAAPVQAFGEIDSQNFHDPDAGSGAGHTRESLDVGVVVVGGQEDELVEAMILPGGEGIVEEPVQSLLPYPRGAGEGSLRGEVDAERQRGSLQDAEIAGQGGGDRFGHECPGADGQVWPVLVANTHGHEQPTIVAEMPLDVAPRVIRQQERAR